MHANSSVDRDIRWSFRCKLDCLVNSILQYASYRKQPSFIFCRDGKKYFGLAATSNSLCITMQISRCFTSLLFLTLAGVSGSADLRLSTAHYQLPPFGSIPIFFDRINWFQSLAQSEPSAFPGASVCHWLTSLDVVCR